MAEQQTIDITKAAENLEGALEELKAATAAMQACHKAWRAIMTPCPAKRSMWKAYTVARDAFYSTLESEGKHFGVLTAVVGQGDLFNGEGEDSQGGPKPDGPKRGGPRKPSSAVVPFRGAAN